MQVLDAFLEQLSDQGTLERLHGAGERACEPASVI